MVPVTGFGVKRGRGAGVVARPWLVSALVCALGGCEATITAPAVSAGGANVAVMGDVGVPAPEPVVAEDPLIPLHEAVVGPAVVPDDYAAPAAPPEAAIEDAPPMPDPSDTWIPGYWWWSSPLARYVWISGTWRNPPPDQTWVAGSWDPNGQGQFVRTPGMWASAGAPPEMVALAVAPPPLQDEVMMASPGPEFAWTPGYYAFGDGSYNWVGGTWGRPPREGLAWVEPRYLSVGGRYYFHPGRWDYPIERRGVVYRPDIHVGAGMHFSPVGVSMGLVAARASYINASAHAIARGTAHVASGSYGHAGVGRGGGGHVGAAMGGGSSHVGAAVGGAPLGGSIGASGHVEGSTGGGLGVRGGASAHTSLAAPSGAASFHARAPSTGASVRASGGTARPIHAAVHTTAPAATLPKPPPPPPPVKAPSISGAKRPKK